MSRRERQLSKLQSPSPAKELIFQMMDRFPLTVFGAWRRFCFFVEVNAYLAKTRYTGKGFGGCEKLRISPTID